MGCSCCPRHAKQQHGGKYKHQPTYPQSPAPHAGIVDKILRTIQVNIQQPGTNISCAQAKSSNLARTVWEATAQSRVASHHHVPLPHVLAPLQLPDPASPAQTAPSAPVPDPAPAGPSPSPASPCPSGPSDPGSGRVPARDPGPGPGRHPGNPAAGPCARPAAHPRAGASCSCCGGWGIGCGCAARPGPCSCSCSCCGSCWSYCCGSGCDGVIWI